MVGWDHRLNGHEFEQTQGDGEGQGILKGLVDGLAIKSKRDVGTKEDS